MNGYEAKSEKEKMQGVKSRGKQAQASKSPWPVEFYKICLMPPTVSVTFQGGYLEAQSQEFSLVLVT